MYFSGHYIFTFNEISKIDIFSRISSWQARILDRYTFKSSSKDSNRDRFLFLIYFFLQKSVFSITKCKSFEIINRLVVQVGMSELKCFFYLLGTVTSFAIIFRFNFVVDILDEVKTCSSHWTYFFRGLVFVLHSVQL